jgi:hypothetical protein
MTTTRFTILLLILLNSLTAFSQDSLAIDSTGVKDKPDEPLHALFGGMGYGSNMVYLGSTISQNSSFGYGSLVYGYRNEFYVSVSGMHLTGFKPFFPLYTGSLSYSHTFNSWFDISAGLYSYLVNSSLRDTLFGNFIYADLTLGVDWRLLYSKISLGGLKMEQSQFYFQIRNSRYFQTPDILNGKATISFDPYVNLIWGPVTTVETITNSDTIVSTFPPFGPGRPGNQAPSESVYTSDFRLMEIDFGLPVSINFDFMSIEVEAGYVLPLNSDTYAQSSKGFLLLVSAFMKIL